MQQRESAFVPRSPLEALLGAADEAALDYITDELIAAATCRSPDAGSRQSRPEEIEAG